MYCRSCVKYLGWGEFFHGVAVLSFDCFYSETIFRDNTLLIFKQIARSGMFCQMQEKCDKLRLIVHLLTDSQAPVDF